MAAPAVPKQRGRAVGLVAALGHVVSTQHWLVAIGTIMQAGLEQVGQGIALVVSDADQPPGPQAAVVRRAGRGLNHLLQLCRVGPG